jgi:glycine/D-amino acid oxidase-like deaminating enzyme
LEPEALQRGGLGAEFTLGIAVEGDFVCPLGDLEESLVRSLEGRITRIAAAARLGGTGPDGVSVIVGEQTCHAELVVACGGAASSSIHPWFETAVLPVRIHATSSTPALLSSRGEFQRGAAISRHRFESWVWGSDGSLDFAGCRWAEGPDMGAGITDERNLNEKVSAAHDAFMRKHLGVATGSFESSRRCGITAYSCDGLPLVGPLPGAPRLLAMTAWGGWGLSAIGAAVEDLATAILDEAAPQSPRELLSPHRML